MVMADQPSTTQTANDVASGPPPTLLPARRRRPPRRHVLRAALCFAAFVAMGMAINLLVVAAIWLRAERSADPFSSVSASYEYLTQAVDWQRPPPTGIDPKWPDQASDGVKWVETSGRRVHHQGIRTYERDGLTVRVDMTVRYDMMARSAGWPFQSMRAIVASRNEQRGDKKFVNRWSGTFDGGWIERGEATPNRMGLPVLFIARGTVLNTLVYASGLALLVLGTRFGIAWVRLRRRLALGRCRACGYDREGLAVGVVCPECGAKGSGVEREDAKIAKG